MLIKIGTRGSGLALAQASEIRRRLSRFYPKIRFEIVKIRTTGDEYQTVELFKKTRIGVFTKEIEKKLLSKEIDLAVHSLKDLPTELPRGLTLGAVPKRAPVEDVLVSFRRHTLSTLPFGAKVGTGSPRRKRQLAMLRPDLVLVDLRGNLETRVGKVLKEKSLDAVVVARAGLERLKKFRRFRRTLDARTLLPAVGQGALGIEIRKNDPRLARLVRRLDHPETRALVTAERAFLRALGGGCRVPVGILTEKVKKRLFIKAAVFSAKNHGFVEAQTLRPLSQGERAARQLARKLLKKGAGRFMAEARGLK